MTATDRPFRTRYTIDSQGRVRVYHGRDAWDYLRRSDERQVRVRDLPKGYRVHEELSDYDA